MRHSTITRISGWALAHDYLIDAKSYLSAAGRLDDDGHVLPRYFLLCHAIEFALKAYILEHAGNDKDANLKEIIKIRHDLNAAFERATALGLQPIADLDKLIQAVARSHEKHTFRYTKSTWQAILPGPETFAALVVALVNQVSAIDPDDADHPTIHGLRGTGILARAEQGYEVDQIANDIGMSRQNVQHYMRFKDQMKVGAEGQKRLRLVNEAP